MIEARGEAGAGTIGDILAARALRRGGDRDRHRRRPARQPGGRARSTSRPTTRRRTRAVLGLLHYPLEANVPIACGGVLVMPGDVIVGDAEGVLVVPAALAEEVARDALEQEQREEWALERVEAGE